MNSESESQSKSKEGQIVSSQEGVDACEDGKVERLEDFTKDIGSKYDELKYLKDKLDGEIEMNEQSKEWKPVVPFLKEENSEVTIEERMEKKGESLACDSQPTNDHGKDKIQSKCLEV
ncbi:hypothetical protein SUGI_0633980 [Cryptomeria japonica]|nr:hypothetical protein SUGI_0633980 [Cryptomeria japonica]